MPLGRTFSKAMGRHLDEETCGQVNWRFVGTSAGPG
jgi:hypothetical protein